MISPEYLNYFISTQITLLISFVLIYALFFQNRRNRTLPPGPKPYPVVGNLVQLGIRPYEEFMKLGKKYGPIFSVDYASYPAVVLNDHKIIRKLLNEEAFSGRPHTQFFDDRTGGKRRGIVMTETSVWNEQRRFVLKNLSDFGFGKKTMESQIMGAVQGLVTKLRRKNGAPIKTETLFSGAVLRTFWQIISGEDVDEDDPEMATLFYLLVSGFANLLATAICIYFPTLNKFAPTFTGYKDFIRNAAEPLWDFVRMKIGKQKELYEEGHPPRHLFDAYFKEINKSVDPKSSFYGQEGEMHMAATVFDLFAAGMETTGTTLSWLFLMLAMHPEIQKKVYEEICANIEQSRLPTLGDRTKMPYTECFMMEVNRYAAVAPLAIFHRTTQDTEVNGYKIPKETWVTPNLFGVMHDPEVWGDPKVIRPERFLTPDGEVDRHNPAYLPFSVGKRRCLGEQLAKDQIFLFITSFCQVFLVETNPADPPPTLEHHAGFLLNPRPHSLIFKIRT